MNSTNVPSNELHMLLSALCDGRITPDQITRLDELVCEDTPARWYYIRYMHIHANLSRYAQVGSDQPPVSAFTELVTDSAGQERRPESVTTIDADRSPMRFQTGPHRTRRIRGKRWATRLMAAAAMVLIIAGLAGWLFPGDWVPGTAFAAVLEQLRTARVIIFTANFYADGQLVETVEAMHLQPNLMRHSLPGGGAKIVDFAQGKMLTIDPMEKKAVLLEATNEPVDYDLDNFLDQFRRHIERMSTHPRRTEKYLGKREIDGRLVKGFEMRKTDQVQILWVDVDTGLPARIKIIDQASPDRSVVISNFQFNVELDESLFSLVPPTGYVVEHAKVDLSQNSGAKDRSELP